MASVTISAGTIGGTQPAAPSGLTTSTAFDGVQLDWANPTNTPIDYIQIASSITNNVAAGFTTVANVKTTAFYDHSTAAGTIYYWVRAVSTLGNIGPWNAADTAGTVGTPQEVTITSPVLGQVVVYDGTKWINTGNVAVTTANTALTSTRVTTSTTGARTAFRAQKIVSGSARAALDGPNIVFNYQGTDGGYDIVGLGARYDSAGDHTLNIFSSTATDNSLIPSQGIILANAVATTIYGNLTVPNSITSTSATGGIGYAAGAGGTVTQSTSKSTGVTINTVSGAITMNASNLATGFANTFTVTNNTVTATDNIITNIVSGAATPSRYVVSASNMTTGSFQIHLRNVSGVDLAEAVVVRYSIIRGAST
jgi:hypothetical protein